MPTVGIIAEYNPFHTGHAYQIAQTKQHLGSDCTTVVVMSGNWVQQANCALADKWLRARLALMGGADLVLELPTVWAVASAERFAQGGVSLLAATGVIDFLSFGSECGQLSPLQQLAQCLDTQAYQDQITAVQEENLSFAARRQKSAFQLVGKTADLLAQPNNNLGVEYLRALNRLGCAIQPLTILRKGAGHNPSNPFLSDAMIKSDDIQTGLQYASATQIRTEVMAGRWGQAEPYITNEGRRLLEENPVGIPSLVRVERALLAQVRKMTVEDWAHLPDAGEEGLPQRMVWAGQHSESMEAFFTRAKTKRYTHARLRRLVLWSYLGLTRADVPKYPPYLRVLGMNAKGREILREMKEKAICPVLTRPANVKRLNPACQRLFALENRCTDLYDLCFPHLPVPGREWTTNPVVL